MDQTDAGVTVKPRRVRCLSTTKETVYWGDDGVNIKAMDLNSGTGLNNRDLEQLTLFKRILQVSDLARCSPVILLCLTLNSQLSFNEHSVRRTPLLHGPDDVRLRGS